MPKTAFVNANQMTCSRVGISASKDDLGVLILDGVLGLVTAIRPVFV
jgi:hypothetical protein